MCGIFYHCLKHVRTRTLTTELFAINKRLVFAGIRGAAESEVASRSVAGSGRQRKHAGIVPRRDMRGPERARKGKKTAKLDVPVAEHVGVGRVPAFQVGQKGHKNMLARARAGDENR